MTLTYRLGRVFMIVLLFTMLGPLVGFFAFMVALKLIRMGAYIDLKAFGSLSLLGLVFGMPLTYAIGAGPALITGLVVGIRQAFFGPVHWLAALVLGIVVTGGYMLSGIGAIDPPEGGAGPTWFPAYVMFAGVVATMVCWWLVRNWHVGAPRGEEVLE